MQGQQHRLQLRRNDMEGNHALTQRKRSIDVGLAVQNDRTKRSAKAREPEGLPFSSSHTRMTVTCGPLEGTRREGPSVPPVQPVEAGAERRCTDSHRAAKQRQNCKPQYRGTRTEGPSVPYTHKLRQHFLSHFDIEDPDHELAGSGSGGLGKHLTASGNCKIIRHAAAVPREALPRFTLGGTFLHFMISYRNATEGESGNNLSFKLYEKIHELSLTDVKLKIPWYAVGNMAILCPNPYYWTTQSGEGVPQYRVPSR